MRALFRRISYWFRARREAAALREEIEFHRSMTQAQMERDGLTPDEARFAARRQMGNVAIASEDASAVWIWPWLQSVRQDAAYALRSLWRQPGFTLVSLSVLGIAIGLNTGLFTVVAGAAFRPMSGLTDPSRVVTVSSVNVLGRGGLLGLSFPEYQSLTSAATSFEGLAAARPLSVRLEAGPVGRSISAYLVTANYFDVLGVRMELGRGFQPGEDRRGSAQAVAVLAYQVWESRYGADPTIVGRQIRVNNIPFTVVGIASRQFVGPEGSPNRIWLPISMLPLLRPNDPFATTMLDRAQDCCVTVTGRLTPAATRDSARAEVQVLSTRFRSSVGMTEHSLAIGGTQFLSGRRGGGEALAILGVLSLGLTLVLLIACANVGNLLLARAAARVNEIGVRLSLGAGRARIVRQLLTEGFVLAIGASVVGLFVSMWLPPLVLSVVAGTARPFDLSLDGWVLVYALAVAVLSCLAFALAPALNATKCDIATALKHDAAMLQSRFPLRSTLLAVQVAVSVVLLTSAALLLRGVAQARLLDPGFAMDGVAVATIDVPEESYDVARRRAFVTETTTELQRAGIVRFGFASNEPLGNESSMTGMRLQGESPAQARTVEFINVSPGYFDALSIPIVAGRDFIDADEGRSVVIVNQTMARRYWPGGTAVGQVFFGGGNRQLMQIVGVVADAHVASMEEIEPVLFLPPGDMSQRVPRLLFSTDEPSTSATIAAIVERVDGRARVDVTPLRDRFENWLGDLRLAPLVASAIGVFALGVAVVGMLGVFSYIVRQRTREIGIRMALGAGAGDVLRLVLASSSRAVLAGLAVGGLGGFAASQVLRSSLYGLSPLDPIAYGGVLLLLALAACLASYIPARRALRIDPVRALRYE